MRRELKVEVRLIRYEKERANRMDQQSNQVDTQASGDGMADALSAVAVVIIPVVAVVYWLSGMPT